MKPQTLGRIRLREYDKNSVSTDSEPEAFKVILPVHFHIQGVGADRPTPCPNQGSKD